MGNLGWEIPAKGDERKLSVNLQAKEKAMIAPSLIDLYEDWWTGRNRQPLLAIYVGDPRFDLGSHMRPWMDRSIGSDQLIGYALSFCAKAQSYQPLRDVLDVLDTRLEKSGLGYLGAAFPNGRCNFGPVPVAGYVSGYAQFDAASKSMWFELDEGWSLERIAALPDNAASPWAELCRGAANEIVQRFAGRLLIVDHPMFGLLDILAALRTTNRLIMDCVDSLELVLAANAALERIWWHYWQEMRALLDPANQGLYSNWGLISRRPFASSQADFSVLLSPSLFEQVALPSIGREGARLGRAIYHLDGPQQINYLDMILSIPEVRAIQWPPYPGHPVLSGCWDDMLHKVIDSGRRLILQEIPPDPQAMRRLFSRFPSEAFHLTCWVPDVKTGEKLLSDSI